MRERSPFCGLRRPERPRVGVGHVWPQCERSEKESRAISRAARLPLAPLQLQQSCQKHQALHIRERGWFGGESAATLEV